MQAALDDKNFIHLARRALYDLWDNETDPGKKDQYKALGYDTYSEARQFFISYSYNDYRPLNGKIAEARVWSVARTPEQIWENMYNVENPKDDPTLLGYWKFNDGKGNTVKDYSRYGNDGQAKYDLRWPDGIEIPKINEDAKDTEFISSDAVLRGGARGPYGLRRRPRGTRRRQTARQGRA